MGLISDRIESYTAHTYGYG